MFFIQVVHGRPGGRLQFFGGGSKMAYGDEAEDFETKTLTSGLAIETISLWTGAWFDKYLTIYHKIILSLW